MSYDKTNNRHDAMKIESLLGYGGYLDHDKGGGPLGLSNAKLEEPVKAFQAQNGLEVDGLMRPNGPTIRKMKELYGGVYGGTPAPTPAMMDAHVERKDAGEEGFLWDGTPPVLPRPNPRLDGKAHLMEFERWNRDWARNAQDSASYAKEYESYIRDPDKDHGHDPGLIFARDFTKQVQALHGNGGAFAKKLLNLLNDRPDLQRAYLGGAVPQSPPVGTFKPGGEQAVKTWIDDDRIANGIAPHYRAASAEAAPIQRINATAPAASTAPDPNNLLEYGENFGYPGGAIPDPVAPPPGVQLTEGDVPPRGQPVQAEPAAPPPPAPVPPRPNPAEPDIQAHDPNQMAPVHQPEQRQPEPDWASMTDEELEAAEKEAEYRLKIARDTLNHSRNKHEETKSAHATRSGEAGKNIINDALESAAQAATLGALAGGKIFGPKGLLVGGALSGAGGAAWAVGKEAIRYGVDEIRVRRGDERVTEVSNELADARARLDRIRAARAARQAG